MKFRNCTRNYFFKVVVAGLGECGALLEEHVLFHILVTVGQTKSP